MICWVSERALPHSAQKRAVGELRRPHREQSSDRITPQLVQNLASESLSELQVEHFIAAPSTPQFTANDEGQHANSSRVQRHEGSGESPLCVGQPLDLATIPKYHFIVRQRRQARPRFLQLQMRASRTCGNICSRRRQSCCLKGSPVDRGRSGNKADLCAGQAKQSRVSQSVD